MPMPWESTPRRSVRTMRSAVRLALAGDIWSASRTETMKAVSASADTVTGSSAMARFSGKSGDLDAGVLELVAPVDGGQHRGDALDRPRVGERAHVDGAQAHRGPQIRDQLLGFRVAPAEEEVALDRVLARGELVGRDVVEGGDHAGLGAEQLLGLLRGGALRGRGEQAPTSEGQRHHRDRK